MKDSCVILCFSKDCPLPLFIQKDLSDYFKILATMPPHETEYIRTLERIAQVILVHIGCDALSDKTHVQWNPRLSTTAGTANIRTSTISLNPQLQKFPIAETVRTFLHELAHLIVRDRYHGQRRIQSHGTEWRKACCDLGIPDETARHQLPFPRRTMKYRYFYQCPGCRFILKRVRKLHRYRACGDCCRKFSGGKYDERFRFVSIENPDASSSERQSRNG